MNNISEQILEAVDILTDAKISTLSYDRTVRAVIYSVINVDTGIYYVKYEGNVFTAYAEDVEKQYKVDEEVYVKVPEGDFSNRKIITGRVDETSLSQGQMTQLSNFVVDISPTFDKFYSFNTNTPWKVIAGSSSSEDYVYGSANASYSPTSSYHGLFQQYANKYEYIRIKAEFETQFHDVHTQGNYGIEVAFFAKGEDNTVTTIKYRLDLESFSGDPYSLSVFSPQQVIFKAQTNYLLGLKYVRLFQEDFEYDTMPKDYETGERTTITKTPNIFVQNVQINYVDVLDLTQEPYYCYIATPKGSIFSSTTSSIDLEARLLSYGNSVNTDKCTYQWFQRDLSVFIGNELYDKNAGFGWTPIDEDSDTLTITSSEVIYQQRYKCIVIYNDEVVMTAEKEILNINNGYGYHIEQVTEGATIKLQLINDNTNTELKGNWYVSYPDGSYSKVSNSKKNSIEVQSYLTYTSVTFYCEVYNYSYTTIVGTIEHTIFNSESEEDVTITYIGEDTFRYDANGDITIEDSEKERTIQVELAWKEGYGSSYRIEWLGPDGDEIPTSKPTTSGDGYCPKNSMMEDIWVDISNVLHYNIKYKYKVNYNNNIFTVKIITIDEKVYTFTKEILFIKDGDQGTNGTTYIATVRPCDNNGNKLSGFQGLWYYSSSWKKSMNLKCYVYKDGELINNNTNYSITYKWYLIGANLSSGKTTDELSNTVDEIEIVGSGSIKTNSEGKDLQRYVKISVNINDKINDRTTMIYALYPIDVVYGSTLSDFTSIDISDIPSYIKYTSSGINPSFYSNNITFTYKGNDYTGSVATSGIISLDNTILQVEMKDGYKYLKPATSFIFEDTTIGILKCIYSSAQFIIHPVIMYLDTYGNEAINGWDGTSLDITNGYYYLKDGARIYLTQYQEKDIQNGYITINGTQYEVKQGEAHILAPQIGAGEKDSANRFTGIVMGKDTGQEEIGLYGYNTGINTFGLLHNGKAYFGVAGSSGRLELDGKKGLIASGNYVKDSTSQIGNGMQIDLPKGHIDAYNFSLTSRNMELDSGTGSFNFRLGTAFDNTTIANADGEEVENTTRDQSQFKIYFSTGKYEYYDGEEKKDVYENFQKDVFIIKSDKYFLQTRNFSSGEIIQSSNICDSEGVSTQAKQDIEIPAQGTKIDLAEGEITSYDFELNTPTLTIDSGSQGNSEFSFDVSNKGKFNIEATYTYEDDNKEIQNEKKSLFYVAGTKENDAEDKSKYYLQTLNYNKDVNDIDKCAGTKIDLENGTITSYDFHIETPTLTIDSGSQGNSEFSFDVSNKGKFNIYATYTYEDDNKEIQNKKKSLFYAAGAKEDSTENESTYYLQTLNYNKRTSTTNGAGTKINLASGEITSYNFKLNTPSLTIASTYKDSDDDDDDESLNDNNYGKFNFNVCNGGEFNVYWKNVTSTVKSLIYIKGSDGKTPTEIDTTNNPDEESDKEDKGNFYLQSYDYNRTNKTGMKIDLANGKITSYVFSLETKYLTMSSDDTGIFKLNVYDGGEFNVYSDDNSGGSKKLIYIKGQKDLISSDDANEGSFYLQSHDYDNAGNGTKIDLVRGRIISYNFSLKTNYLTMSSDDNGTFVIDVQNGGKFQVKDSSGKYGGNTILMNVNGDNYYLQSASYSHDGDNVTGVHIDLSGEDSYFGGTITADAGKIGGWKIDENGLSNGDTIYLKNDGSMKVGENFEVSNSGVLTVKEADISGKITADEGKIGGWEITSSGLSNGTEIYLYSNGTAKIGGLTIDKNEDNSYTSTFKGIITAESGSIGGWEINATQLSSPENPTVKTTLSSSGGISTQSLTINSRSVDVGYFGQIRGAGTDGKVTFSTNNIGIQSQPGYGIILESSTNIRLSGLSGESCTGMYLYADECQINTNSSGGNLSIGNGSGTCTINVANLKVTAATQTGIRATFGA